MYARFLKRITMEEVATSLVCLNRLLVQESVTSYPLLLPTFAYFRRQMPGDQKEGVILLFNEPPDEQKSDLRWQLFVLKNGEMLNGKSWVNLEVYLCDIEALQIYGFLSGCPSIL